MVAVFRLNSHDERTNRTVFIDDGRQWALKDRRTILHIFDAYLHTSLGLVNAVLCACVCARNEERKIENNESTARRQKGKPPERYGTETEWETMKRSLSNLSTEFFSLLFLSMANRRGASWAYWKLKQVKTCEQSHSGKKNFANILLELLNSIRSVCACELFGPKSEENFRAICPYRRQRRPISRRCLNSCWFS